jgi:hypothetical protein
MWDSSIIHALSWIFMKKYQTFKVHPFPGSDMRFKYYSCAFMNFHEKISKFQISPFSRFKCENQVLFMRFHKFSWKNIKLSKFVFFLNSDVRFNNYSCAFINFHEKYQTFKVRSFPSLDLRFKYYSCAFINFHEIYQTFKVHPFTSSDVRFKYLSCAFMNFHEKISNFQSWFFSQFKYGIQVFFMRIHEFSLKISNVQSSPFSRFRCEIQVLFMRFHEFSWKISNFQSLPFFLVQMWDSSNLNTLSWIFMKKF